MYKYTVYVSDGSTLSWYKSLIFELHQQMCHSHVEIEDYTSVMKNEYSLHTLYKC